MRVGSTRLYCRDQVLQGTLPLNSDSPRRRSRWISWIGSTRFVGHGRVCTWIPFIWRDRIRSGFCRSNLGTMEACRLTRSCARVLVSDACAEHTFRSLYKLGTIAHPLNDWDDGRRRRRRRQNTGRGLTLRGVNGPSHWRQWMIRMRGYPLVWSITFWNGTVLIFSTLGET